MRKAKKFFLTLLLPLFLNSCAYNYGVYYDNEKVKSDFQKFFKNTKVVKVEPSEIPGIYEIYYKGDFPGIVYYCPEKKILIFGEFWSINGTSITGDKLLKFAEEEKGVRDGGERGQEFDSRGK